MKRPNYMNNRGMVPGPLAVRDCDINEGYVRLFVAAPEMVKLLERILDYSRRSVTEMHNKDIREASALLARIKEE